MIITFLNNINNEFEFLGTYFAMSLGIVSVLVMLSWILSWRVRNANRVYSYECGFSPFLSTRLGLSMHTYMVSILFILFDIELALLLPVIFLDTSTPAKLLVIVILMLSLIVGLFIEIYSGLLDFFRW